MAVKDRINKPVKKFAEDIIVEDTYLSPEEKANPINRRSLRSKLLKGYIRGKEFISYKGQKYIVPVFYDTDEEE